MLCRGNLLLFTKIMMIVYVCVCPGKPCIVKTKSQRIITVSDLVGTVFSVHKSN